MVVAATRGPQTPGTGGVEAGPGPVPEAEAAEAALELLRPLLEASALAPLLQGAGDDIG